MSKNNYRQMDFVERQAEWYHYIGKQYKIPRFIAEARKKGISRRVGSHFIKGMAFGDIVYLLRWNGKDNPVTTFATMRVIGLTFEQEIAKKVGDRLIEEGRAVYQEAEGRGIAVLRECGSYTLAGSYAVDCELSEIVKLAEQAAGDEKLFVMVQGRLDQTYPKPIELDPSPNFTRSFQRINIDIDFALPNPNQERETFPVYAIDNYARA